MKLVRRRVVHPGKVNLQPTPLCALEHLCLGFVHELERHVGLYKTPFKFTFELMVFNSCCCLLVLRQGELFCRLENLVE